MNKFFLAILLFHFYSPASTSLPIRYTDVIKDCATASPNNSRTYCYVGNGSNFSCQGVSHITRCQKASTRLIRNVLQISTGCDKDQFTLLPIGKDWRVCYSPRPGEMPKGTNVLALVFQMAWQLVGQWDMMELTFGCVYGQPNLTSHQLADSKCCVNLPEEFSFNNSAFYSTIAILPLSAENRDFEESNWIMLKDLSQISLDGTKLGKINLTNDEKVEEGPGIPNTSKTEQSISITEEIEEREMEEKSLLFMAAVYGVLVSPVLVILVLMLIFLVSPCLCPE